MSMVAALLLGANVYAIDNVKVNGDANLFYSTTETDAVNAPDLFDEAASAGQFALNIGMTADLTEAVSAGVNMTALSTLGLHNTLVSNVWEAQDDLNGGDYWFSEAWLATTTGETTFKAGRQALDTPLAFTETWSIAQNTFDSIVVINQDLADTTLVGAYIGSSNSGNGALGGGGAGIGSIVSAPDATTSQGSRYNNFGQGAYTVGVINNSIKPLTINAWYYEAQHIATGIWASADLNMDGILAGVQYATFDPAAANTTDGSAVAAMLGYEMKDVATIKVAYSTTDDNTDDVGAGFNLAGAQSKMYTEMWWNYGNVAAAGTDSYAITVEGKAMDTDLTAGYYVADRDRTGTAADQEVTEITLTASRSYGALDASLAIIMDEYDYAPAAMVDDEATTVQVYLTYNF